MTLFLSQMAAPDVQKVVYVFYCTNVRSLPVVTIRQSLISVRTRNIQKQVNEIFSRLALLDTKPISLMAPSGCTEVMEC